MTRGLIAAVLVVLSTSCSRTTGVAATSDELMRLDSIASWFRTHRSVPNLSVTVLRRGGLVAHRDYGSATAGDEGVGGLRERVFGLGSIKKTATAVAVLHLVEQGVLALDDSVSTHAPSVQLSVPGPTVEQLLRHTSGFPQSSDDELVTELVFAPGSRWEYNNANFDKLDEVIAISSGRTLDGLLAGALGGRGLGMCEGERAAPPVLPGHHLRQGELQQVEGPCWFFGSSVALAEWVGSVFSGDVIPAEMIDTMVEPTTVMARSIPFGAGVSLRDLRGVRRWSHSGHDEGSTAAFGHYPDHDLTVAVAGDSEGLWDPDGLEMAVAGLFLGLRDGPEPTALAGGVEPGAFQAGPVTFQLQPGEHGYVDLSMASSSDPTTVFVRTTLRPVGGQRYIGIDSPDAAEIVLRESGGIRGLDVHLVGVPWTATERQDRSP